VKFASAVLIFTLVPVRFRPRGLNTGFTIAYLLRQHGETGGSNTEQPTAGTEWLWKLVLLGLPHTRITD